MNLNQIKLFIELNQNDFNLSDAAEKLHIVQSAASRQLKLLEEELETPLFVRNGKRLVGLTHVGEKVLEHAQEIVLAQKNIISVAQALHSKDTGVIRLGTTHTQARYMLPDTLEVFKKLYPNVRFHIEESSPSNLYKMLFQDRVDVIICSEMYHNDAELNIYEIYEWGHSLIAPPEHDIWKKEVSLKSVADYSVLSYIKGFTRSEKVLSTLREHKPDFEFDILASDADVIKFYVKKGFGVGIIAQVAYDPDYDSELRMHFLGDEIGLNKSYCSFLTKRVMPDYVHEFIKVFRQTARERFKK